MLRIAHANQALRTQYILAFVLLLILAGRTPGTWGAPNVTDVSLRGLQIGGTTTLVVEGTELLPELVLVAPFPIVSQSSKPGSTSMQVEIEVAVHERVSPGIYQIRFASDLGISNPVAMGLDRLVQRPFASEPVTMPVALSGVLSGTQTMSTRFRGEKGAPFVAEVEAQRLGSKFKPVLRLKDSRRRQVAWSSPLGRIGGDARMAVVLPEDGEYIVELHDVLYRAAVPGSFRLKLGELAYADSVFPLGVQTGTRAPLQFASSNLPSTAIVELDANGIESGSIIPAPAVNGAIFTGAIPRVAITNHPEVVETARPGERQELPPIPVAVNGRLETKGEEDQYLLPVTPGARLSFDVHAQRFGSPLDGVLTLRDEQGKQLATGDDRTGMLDPGLEYTVPADMHQLVLAVRDLVGRGGESYIYRIEVTDLGQPDLSIEVETDRVNVPTGATQAIRLQLNRKGYDGPVRLSIAGLPSGIELSGDEIPAGANTGLLTLTAAGEPPVHILGNIIAQGDNGAISRRARAPENEASKRLPWLRDEFAFSITRPAPVVVSWADMDDSLLPLGSQLPLRVTVQRAEGVAGKVRLRLLTTQNMPRKKIKENNQDKEVDDVERALRMDGDGLLGAGEAHAAVKVLVPADLAAQDWGLVVAADLMSEDGKSAVATTTTKVRYKRPFVPFSIELASAADVEAKAGAGDTGKLTGRLRRHPGFTEPVAVTLQGLSAEYPPPTVTVPADREEFALDVRFPFGAKPAEIPNIRLVAVFRPNPANAALSVSSNEVALGVIRVVPGEPPPAEPPLAIFEDDEKFLAVLSKGGGTIALETHHKYSGSASIKVTPDQKYNETVPGLNVKIREQPGTGEYRYLRFAWKKKDGNSICVQVNHDGTWGPGGSGKPGAKFRYHAGPGGECYGASVVVDEKLPREFSVVTRDLFADFGEFTFTGLALSPVDGEYGLFDHFYLGRSLADFDVAPVPKPAP